MGGTGSGAGGSVRAERNSMSSSGSSDWPERAQRRLKRVECGHGTQPRSVRTSVFTLPQHGSLLKLSALT